MILIDHTKMKQTTILTASYYDMGQVNVVSNKMSRQYRRLILSKALITCIFQTVFRWTVIQSFGDVPVSFLKARLKVALLLKPQS